MFGLGCHVPPKAREAPLFTGIPRNGLLNMTSLEKYIPSVTLVSHEKGTGLLCVRNRKSKHRIVYTLRFFIRGGFPFHGDYWRRLSKPVLPHARNVIFSITMNFELNVLVAC